MRRNCERCKYPESLYASTPSLGVRENGWTHLVRCPQCGTFYEIRPAERTGAVELSTEDVKRLFPRAEV